MEIPQNSTDESAALEPYKIGVALIYTIAFLGGCAGMTVFFNIIKSNLRSVTTIVILNLIVVHLLFILTVPFRIHYYATNTWSMGPTLCKLVSGMIHGHMYISFLFYLIILGTRYQAFYRKTDKVEFYRMLHAVGSSLAVWAVGLLICLPVFISKYRMLHLHNTTKCFNFLDIMKQDSGVLAMIYIISLFFNVVALALACCQVHIIHRIRRKYGANFYAQQEFSVQMKNVCFVLVIAVLFIPYQTFRIYYVSHTDQLAAANEVLLALTGLSCLDMLTFLRRNSYCSKS